MELRLLENKHTQIKVGIKQFASCEIIILAYIALHGGRETRRNKRFIYFEIDADLLNRRIEENEKHSI